MRSRTPLRAAASSAAGSRTRSSSSSTPPARASLSSRPLILAPANCAYPTTRVDSTGIWILQHRYEGTARPTRRATHPVPTDDPYDLPDSYWHHPPRADSSSDPPRGHGRAEHYDLSASPPPERSAQAVYSGRAAFNPDRVYEAEQVSIMRPAPAGPPLRAPPAPPAPVPRAAAQRAASVPKSIKAARDTAQGIQAGATLTCTTGEVQVPTGSQQLPRAPFLTERHSVRLSKKPETRWSSPPTGTTLSTFLSSLTVRPRIGFCEQCPNCIAATIPSSTDAFSALPGYSSKTSISRRLAAARNLQGAAEDFFVDLALPEAAAQAQQVHRFPTPVVT